MSPSLPSGGKAHTPQQLTGGTERSLRLAEAGVVVCAPCSVRPRSHIPIMQVTLPPYGGSGDLAGGEGPRPRSHWGSTPSTTERREHRLTLSSVSSSVVVDGGRRAAVPLTARGPRQRSHR
jgi:hypothetical protein